MSKDMSEIPPLDVEGAMNRALAAEQQARAALVRCREEAATILEQARSKARTLVERSDQRIGRIHSHCAQAAASAIDQLVKQEANPAGAPIFTPEQEREILQAAVAKLAAQLTGESGRDTGAREAQAG